MAKRRKRRPRRRKSREEEFEDLIERKAEEFAEEMEEIGRKFGIDMERRAKRWERKYDKWWFNTFGIIGPLIGSIFGLLSLAFGIWILNFINVPLGSGFISEISSFVFTNIHWFFAAFLFFGYSNYISMKMPETYWLISPIIKSIGIVFAIWITGWVLSLINIYVNSSLIAGVSNFLYANVWGIFYVFLVLGYVVIFISRMINVNRF